ncbi:hypothetical protein OBBRIDRAFT_738453 [Obba rivulosa]|uniref:Uncharacterized protein n=1 Tax=Obba rivulosa TaxID=1052685 RepID=A0A8E2DGQ4_9APHY|nr:hypothetical protein OBBRIDRAFT_738453 [Obba rivulosa]
MSAPQNLNYDQNVYLAVTLAPSSASFNSPSVLAVHPSVTHLGTVGQMRDVQLLSVPRHDWDDVQAEVLSSLRSLGGVNRVDVQEPPRTRVKRGGEF